MKRRAPCVVAGFALVLLAVFLVSPAAAIEEADRLWLVGERAFADGLYPAARRALERFVAQYPKDSRLPEAVLLLGKARLQTGDAAAGAATRSAVLGGGGAVPPQALRRRAGRLRRGDARRRGGTAGAGRPLRPLVERPRAQASGGGGGGLPRDGVGVPPASAGAVGDAAGRANARRHEEGRRGARAARRLLDEVSGLAARGRRAVLERLDQEHRQRPARRHRRPARLPRRVPEPRAGGQRAAAHHANPRAPRRPRRAARGLQGADGADSAHGGRALQRGPDRHAPGPPARPGGGVEAAVRGVSRAPADAPDGPRPRLGRVQ